MALDKEYFDSIQIDVVKKKYYNAHKVEAVFEDIRRQAELLTEENRQLREKLAGINNAKLEMGDMMFSAQEVYQGIIDKANAEADEIIADAKAKKAKIISEAEIKQFDAISKVQHCYSKMKEQHMDAIETVNTEWQDFLCSLYDEEEE